MATTERLYRLTVDANQAVRELQKLNTSVAGIDKKFSAVGVGFKAFATAAAAAFGGGQIISGLKSAANAMDDMGKAAQKIGVSLSALQDLKHMADLSGVSFETLQTSVGRLAQAMSGFEGAGKKSADALQAMGVSIKGGTSVGATDELGYRAIEKPFHVRNLHATILHLLGFDHEKFTFRYAGRDFRLTDVHGHVIDAVLA